MTERCRFRVNEVPEPGYSDKFYYCARPKGHDMPHRPPGYAGKTNKLRSLIRILHAQYGGDPSDLTK